MKIWNSYGSEHSANLVMIGQFKELDQLEEAKKLLENLTVQFQDTHDINDPKGRFSEPIIEILREHNFFELNTQEVDQFLFDYSLNQEENKLILETDESDISAFLKIFLLKDAKVEIYSAHNYPAAESRGK